MKANVALPGPHQTLQLLEPVLYEDGLSPEPVSSMRPGSSGAYRRCHGLASALGKMERYQQRFLDRILATGRQVPAPSILRSHPNTEERISRLVELSEEPLSVPRADASVFGGSFTVPEALTQIERAPRWHVSGLWY